MPEVVADFDVNYFCNEDMEVQIQNNSQSVTSMSWSFGDGFISSEDVFSHEYAFAGEYVIELVTENPLSCNLIDLESVSVTVALHLMLVLVFLLLKIVKKGLLSLKTQLFCLITMLHQIGNGILEMVLRIQHLNLLIHMVRRVHILLN